MPTSISADELDIAENSLVQSQSGPLSIPSDSPVPQTPIGPEPSPDEQRSHVEDFEIEPDEVEQDFINLLRAALRRTWWLAQRQRYTASFSRCCKKLEKIFPESLLAKATFFLALWGAAFFIYEYIHVNQPTLALGKDSTAATEASEAAAQWTAYTHWVLDVCPAELRRNKSSPACLNAMNETIPPPPKPQYREFRSIQHLLVRRLVPFINASHALEQQMLASDNYCGIENPLNLFAPTTNCSQLGASSILKRGLGIAEQLLALPGFPLPSIKDVIFLNNMSARIPMVSWVFFWVFCYPLISLLIWAIIARWLRYLGNSRWYWRFNFQWYLTLHLIMSMTVLCNYTSTLSRAMAKDLYIEACLSSEATALPRPVDCRLIVELSASLSSSDSIHVWSIWRGYFLALINQYSTDDFLFLSILLAFIGTFLSMTFSSRRSRVIFPRSWSGDDYNDEEYLPIVKDSHGSTPEVTTKDNEVESDLVTGPRGVDAANVQGDLIEFYE